MSKKSGSEDPEARMRVIERVQGLYEKYDKFQDEKRELIEKLFFMQENFIRKLD